MISSKYSSNYFLNNKHLHAFSLNLLIAFFSFIYFILKNNGVFILCDDFNFQQIPFSMLSNQSIKSGEFLWNWNIELGSPLISSMSYYNLGSPIFWISLLFPSTAYPYIVGWLYILVYALSGLFSYSYIQYFVKDKKYALIGSILYSFSGFQSVNLIFFFFHNVVAFFPLLLLGLEKRINDKKIGILAFAVFINALLNYYFFISEMVFLFLYFFIRFVLFGNRNEITKNLIICIKEGIIGLLMSSILFFPSIFSIIHNSRANIHPKLTLFMSNREYLQLIRAFLFPSEIMQRQSFIYDSDFSSLSAYLPLLGVSLVLAYIIKRKNDWLSIMVYCCIGFSFIPVLNNTFTLFTSNYHRWYFMIILIFCLSTSLVLENRLDYHPQQSTCFLTFTSIIFVIFIILWDKFKYQTIFDSQMFYMITIITVMGLLFLSFLYNIKNNVVFFRVLLLSISIFCLGTTIFTINEYQNFRKVDATQYYSKLIAIQAISCENDYRVITNEDDSTSMIRNIAMAGGLPGANTFSSSVHPSIMEFYENLGFERRVFTPKLDKNIMELLSVKYYITEVEDTEQIPFLKSVYNNVTYYVYKTPKHLPIGFTYNYYLLQSDYLMTDPKDRSAILLKALVIPDSSEQIMKQYLQPYNSSRVSNSSRQVSTSFERTGNSFKSIISTDQKKYAFFSVPYDTFWQATVNNVPVDIISSNGLMAIPVESGTNTIVFKYNDYSILLGILFSIIGSSLFFAMLYYEKNRNSKHDL